MMKSFTGSPLILTVLRVMAFCLGKLANFPNKVERFPKLESNGPPEAVGRPPAVSY